MAPQDLNPFVAWNILLYDIVGLVICEQLKLVAHVIVLFFSSYRKSEVHSFFLRWREGFHEKKCGKWGRIWARAAISERATAKRPIYQTFMAKTISHLIVVLTPKRSGCPGGTGHAVAFDLNSVVWWSCIWARHAWSHVIRKIEFAGSRWVYNVT